MKKKKYSNTTFIISPIDSMTTQTKTENENQNTTQTTTQPSTDMMQAMIISLSHTIEQAQLQLKKAQTMIAQLAGQENLSLWERTSSLQKQHREHSEGDEEGTSIEGAFDGYNMLWEDQKKYPVPLNYASKTKLIPWDKLKLKIRTDGWLIYKVIWHAERKHERAVLSKGEDSKYIAITEEGHTYFLNQAAVTFYKGMSGDELYIITNADGTGTFAAIEAIIKQ